MTPLPQRKKSAEEIAKLRESLGVPGAVTEEIPPEPGAAASEPPASAIDAPSPDPAPQAVAEHEPQQAVREPKPVRSLRKAEQAAVPGKHKASPPDSSLPHQRHSAREIEELRRREVLELMNARPNPRLLPAQPALVVPGYLFTVAAAAGIWFYQIPLAATLAAVLASMSIAALIWRRKPVSRHHAAFIAVLALFLLIFSALYYFPHLRHAT